MLLLFLLLPPLFPLRLLLLLLFSLLFFLVTDFDLTGKKRETKRDDNTGNTPDNVLKSLAIMTSLAKRTAMTWTMTLTIMVIMMMAMMMLTIRIFFPVTGTVNQDMLDLYYNSYSGDVSRYTLFSAISSRTQYCSHHSINADDSDPSFRVESQ